MHRRSPVDNLDDLLAASLAPLASHERTLERLAIDIEVTGRVQTQIATDDEREVLALCVAVARVLLGRQRALEQCGVDRLRTPSRN